MRSRRGVKVPALLGAALLLGSCWASQGELTKLKGDVNKLQDRLGKVERRAFCPAIVKELLEDVMADADCDASHVCTKQGIAGYVDQHDPSGQARFFAIMGSQPYVALYPKAVYGSNGKIGFSFGESTWQLDRLDKLVQPPWLPITTFLLVAHTGSGSREDIEQARARIGFVSEHLRQLDFSAYDKDAKFDIPNPHDPASSAYVCAAQSTQRLIRWAFRFTLSPSEISNEMDRPPTDRALAPLAVKSKKKTAPARPDRHALSDALFVFRIDCPLAPKITPKKPAGGDLRGWTK